MRSRQIEFALLALLELIITIQYYIDDVRMEREAIF